MITYQAVGRDYFERYDQIPMTFTVKSILDIERVNNGLGGYRLVEKAVNEYVKDLGQYEVMTGIDKRFDIRNWAFYMAFLDDMPIGAMTVLYQCPEIIMLNGRDDISLLWDIRVDPEYQKRGVGSTLLNIAQKWSKEKGVRQLKIECQNNNVAACKFYHQQGAYLGAIDEYAYCGHDEVEHEAQLIWYIDIC